jgi:hypothetical protein
MSKASVVAEAIALGLGKFHKAYRILLSRLTGTPDRHLHVGDAGIVHFKLKMHVYELIRGALDKAIRHHVIVAENK